MEFECSSVKIEALPSGRIRVIADDAAPTPNEIWSKAQVAHALRVTPRTIGSYMRHKTNPIPHTKIGRSVRFLRKDVEEWLALTGDRHHCARVSAIFC